MTLSDIGSVVAKFAPTLGALLPIPGGALIGDAIAKAFGGDINKPAELEQLISRDPQAQLKFAEIQERLEINKGQVRIRERELDSQDYGTEVDDKKSARGMRIELAKVGIRDYVQELIAIIVVMFSMAMLLFYQYTPTTESKELVLADVAILSQVLQFYFGSSRGERKASQ